MGRSYQEARRLVVDDVRAGLSAAPAIEIVALADADGRVLGEDVAADRDQPPFDRSTRDGFAVRSADVAAPPALLELVGEVAAGRAFEGAVAHGQCVEIMTGAPVPRGADAVLMVEHAERPASGRIRALRSPAAGENVVPAASEMRRGALACARGTRLDHAALALLASVGRGHPAVVARPAVAILSTGDELVGVDETPGPAQIRNSNAFGLAAQVTRAGGRPLLLPIARDDRGALRDVLARAIESAEVLVITGGVSAGKYDFVELALADLGASVLFDGADIRPGKPVVFGRVGAARRPYFGLPGNPLSALVTFELFARPAIELLAGAAEVPLRLWRARLGADLRQRALPLTVFAPVRLDGDGAEATAVPLSSMGSGDLAGLARAAGFAVVPPGVTLVAAGEHVDVLPR